VDLNPLAVELCKVALWLEAHNPGQPLNFLDHHIKCGNAIVGFVRQDELDKGVPSEAFATMPGDDKDLAAKWRNANKKDRADIRQIRLAPPVQQRLEGRLTQWNALSALPERTPAEIEAKKDQFLAFTQSNDAFLLAQIAAIPIAQFYVPKTPNNDARLVTDAQFRRYWTDGQTPQGEGSAMALATAIEKRFFHWFLEFPDITARGGFDCILGNPPYLGRAGIRSTYGDAFCGYVQWEFIPAGISDLVVFFVRRIFHLLKLGGFTAFITTNSIKDGEIRKDGLEQLIEQGGQINMAVRAIRWPGRANLFVSLVAIHNGVWKGKHSLDGREVDMINAFFEESAYESDPLQLADNDQRVYQGSIFRGDGFLLTHEEAAALCQRDPRNAEAIRQIINGQELNNEPNQAPQRSTIDFFNQDLTAAQSYPDLLAIVEDKVKPVRMQLDDRTAINRDHIDRWWQYAFVRENLYLAIRPLKRCFAAARVTKYLNFSSAPTEYIFTDTIYIFTTDRWDLYAVVQSTIHEVWARKYSGALKQDLRYSPSKCFETFAFPDGLWQNENPTLAALGEKYHEHRKSLMLALWLGLTDIYNLVHTRDLSPAKVAKVSKKPAEAAERGYEGLVELRRLHRELDLAIRDAYGWQNLDLGHDFHEVETLADNDRVRYTISTAARKEILSRLLALNHTRAEAEKSAAKPTKSKRSKKAPAPEIEHIEMFPADV